MHKLWDRTARQDRFDPVSGQPTMKAIVTANAGGYEQLQCREVARPEPEPGEVLLEVLAAGVNNTEINTRLGWYSASVTTATDEAARDDDSAGVSGGGWDGDSPFPFIQGTDCCGRIAGLGEGVAGGALSIGDRALVRSSMRPAGFESMDNVWLGSNFDGAFAQFVTVPASEVFPIQSDWTDAELATVPCAYGTAENMVHRAGVGAGDHVLVSGASGGVGSAVVQLAKRRGAQVTAICGEAKKAQVLAVGADRVLGRGDDVLACLGESAVDVVVDNVAGEAFGTLLQTLCRGGRYVSSGAIAGPMVALDMRTFYLKDLTLIGCTAWDEPVFSNLVGYIQRGEIKPLLAKTFPLECIAEAQQEFLGKRHVGSFVLMPPAIDA